MALQVNETVSKQMTVKCTRKEFTDKETGAKNLYNQYAIVVNGIPIVVRTAQQDNTGRYLLEDYFDK